ncbi:DUF572 domain-containing protein, partial [archaeon]
DFDPSLLEGAKIKSLKRSKFMDMRMMLPFSLRCNTCGEYMYKGKKFNSKKEDLEENYMGIRKIRFYIKCTNCAAEISFKTDPKNADYECESGAQRNYEMWKDNRNAKEEEEKAREEEESLDAMKALENKTMDNKNEMDVLDALDEIRAINQRHNRTNTDKVLELLHQKKDVEIKAADPSALTAEDEALIRSIKFKSASSSHGGATQEEDGATSNASAPSKPLVKIVSNAGSSISSSNISMPVIIKKKRKIDEVGEKPAVEEVKKAMQDLPPPEEKPAAVISAVLGMFADYGDDNDDDNE